MGLRKLGRASLLHLRENHVSLEAQLDGARADPDTLSEAEEAELLVALGMSFEKAVVSPSESRKYI